MATMHRLMRSFSSGLTISNASGVEAQAVYVASTERKVTIHDDAVHEADETFALHLERASGTPPRIEPPDGPLIVTILGNDSGAALSDLSLSGVTLNPTFTRRTNTYTGTAPYEVVSTTVTAELNRPEDAFTIEKDGDIYTSGDAVPLIAGSSSPNVVTIEVTLPDSSTARTYTVVVTRKERERELVTVPSNWSLIPDGFGPGKQFRLMFVTSEYRDATSSSIADYDAFVRETGPLRVMRASGATARSSGSSAAPKVLALAGTPAPPTSVCPSTI